jgi:hypothetical protein
LVVVPVAVLLFVSSACGDLVVGSVGSGAGQYENPGGVAVDASNGHVYVVDQANNRMDVFDEAGGFLFAFGWKVNASTPEEKLQICTTASGCRKGAQGSGAGQLSEPETIAVDSSSHTVYVGERENSRVQKFDAAGGFLWAVGGEVDKVTHANLCTVAVECGAGKAGAGEGQFEGPFNTNRLNVAVGPGGGLYVADTQGKITEGFKARVQRFEESGADVGPQILLLGTTANDEQSLAVDSVGDIYLARKYFLGGPETTGVYKYDLTGSPVAGWGVGGIVNPSNRVGPIALDPKGDLFVSDPGNLGTTGIAEYDPAGTEILVFFGNGTLKAGPQELAFHHSATGDLFAVEFASSEPGRVVQLALPEPGPLLVPGSTEASPVGNVRATLKVQFNPEGKTGTAHFQYISKEDFEKDGNSFGAGTHTTPESAPTPADFANHTPQATNTCVVPTEATCLKPETTYYFRAFAKNSDGSVTGEKEEFTTLPALQIDATWATEVGTDFARLHAEVNPLSIDATAYFQYVPEGADFQAHGFENAVSVPSPAHPLDFGTGETPVVRVADLLPLEPGTVYHYRLIASDPYFLPVVSAEHEFTTFAPGGTGGEACSANEAFRTGPSAALPDCRAYEMVTPIDKNNGDILTRINITGYQTNLDQSSVAGSGFTYSSYRAFAKPESAPFTDQYLAFRDPVSGWSSQAIDPPRGPQFRFELENEYQAFSPELDTSWMLQEGEPPLDPCAPAGFTGLYRRESATGAYQALSCAQPTSVPSVEYMPELQGFSTDGSHALIRIDNKLTPNASSATVGARPVYQVYEATGTGTLRLVSVLPNGEANATDSSAGSAFNENVANHNRLNSVLNALSSNGTRVFWSTGLGGSGPLYLRLNADQAQSKIVSGKCSEPVRACTIGVSETVTVEGARFQAANPQGSKALFTVTKGPLAGSLYEFDDTTEPSVSHLIATGLMKGNILGSSEDLSRVYFASEAASVGGQAEGAVPGQPNVYLADEGTIRFVATLTNGETADLGNQYSSPIAEPVYRTARVSPDGASLVFMSTSLASSERTAGYDNTDAVSGRPDAEVYLYDATANGGAGKLRCVSCNPSGERPLGHEVEKGVNGKIGLWGAARIPVFETELYQPRYLADDGKRVFFDSYDALVLGDTNGKQDVYEWEAPDTGSCTSESVSYVAGSEGCLSLISSGRSPGDSEFLDASPTGSDVFFTTVESLLPQDAGLIDVYDARVDGGFPPPPAPAAGCEGEACQGPPVAPLDTTPASFAFNGPGNPIPALATPKAKTKPMIKACGKGRVRKRGRCVKARRAAKRGSVSRGRAGRSSRRPAKRNGRAGR